ncbi:MAG: M28 family metallopeptidase [Promethearchaeota archaeon]
MSIDENYAYEITEKLAFPRLIGSKGEKKAIEIVINEFKKAGYETIHREKFKTSFYNWTFARYIFIPFGFILILLALSFFVNHFITLALGIFFYIVFSRVYRGSLNNEIKLNKNEDKNHDTENIFVDLKSKNSKAKIVFLAHWDSKSQTFPVNIRIFVFVFPIFGFLIMLALYFILSAIRIFITFDIPPMNSVLLYTCIGISIIGALNWFNKIGNKSPGASDNAASVGTVIELARYFKSNPVDNIDFIFLSTSSEELNLGGAKDFIKRHEFEFDKKSTYFINFDLIGSRGFIRLVTRYGLPLKKSSKKLNNYFIKSSKELNIDCRPINLYAGAWSDYMPIVKEGFEACWLGSQGALKYVHTIKDNMDLVSKEGLKKGLILSVDVVEKLNEELN